MKLLITGSSGFVGQNLLEYLEGFEIYSITRNQLNTPSLEQLNSCDTLIHLAGKAHDLKQTSNPQEYYQVNFELTKQLYDAFLHSDAKKFIFISSVKVAADTVEGILNEEVKPDPQTDYGKSKLMAEEYIQSQVLPEGKSYYILRPCMIHGPGNKGNLNLLYRLVAKGIPYPLAAFENKRSFLSIENLCFVIKELIERSDIFSGVYHVADDEAISTNELINVISGALEIKPRLWKINSGSIRLLAKIGDTLRLPLNSERLKKLTESYVVSNSKIKGALGKEFPVEARAGLRKTILSFKE
ncbi:NAD-dependent epimerase/dehydratase family protein [Pseudopedobacter beijingensis]|uniref:NAD-dependent epimerase/dehydratase family protein n=1 Tax=Pseudopedobacter beijingensis TaxID=1207056 RepID=A0ABW4I9N1_9SPHI